MGAESLPHLADLNKCFGNHGLEYSNSVKVRRVQESRDTCQERKRERYNSRAHETQLGTLGIAKPVLPWRFSTGSV